MRNSKRVRILVAVCAGLLVIGGVLYAYRNYFAAPADTHIAEENIHVGEASESVREEDLVDSPTGESTSGSAPPTPAEAQPAETEEMAESPADSAASSSPETERFVVPLGATEEIIADALYEQGFIKSKTAFRAAFSGEIMPGAYRLSKTMSVFEVADALKKDPYMAWIVIPEGWRKEEIATRLTARLGWSEAQKDAWINTYTTRQYDYIEGVYFPDTYLIALSDTPIAVADRLIAKFNEKFAPYLSEFASQNMQWSRGLTFASLVEREAANDSEMPLIAGILWNRLNSDMYLNVDATLQYARGDTGKGWWAPLSRAAGDLDIDSSYNTYTHKGLPPHPIANPGLSAIEAVLHPAETNCFYYLHDSEGNLHCSETYEEHQENIKTYLLEEA